MAVSDGGYRRRRRHRRRRRSRNVTRRIGPKRIVVPRRQVRRLRRQVRRYPRTRGNRPGQVRRAVGRINTRRARAQVRQHHRVVRAHRRQRRLRRQVAARSRYRTTFGRVTSPLGELRREQRKAGRRSEGAYLRRAVESGVKPPYIPTVYPTSERQRRGLIRGLKSERRRYGGRLERFGRREAEAVTRFETERERERQRKKFEDFWGKVRRHIPGPAGDIISLAAASQDPRIQDPLRQKVASTLSSASRGSDLQTAGTRDLIRPVRRAAGRFSSKGLGALADVFHTTGAPGRAVHKALGSPGGEGTKVLFEMGFDPLTYAWGGGSVVKAGGRGALRTARELERIAPGALHTPGVQRLIERTVRAGDAHALEVSLKRRLRRVRSGKAPKAWQTSPTRLTAREAIRTRKGGVDIVRKVGKGGEPKKVGRYALHGKELRAAGQAIGSRRVAEAVRRPGVALGAASPTGAREIKLPFAARPVDLRGLEVGVPLPMKNPLTGRELQVPVLIGRASEVRAGVQARYAKEDVMREFEPRIRAFKERARAEPSPAVSEEGRNLRRDLQRALSAARGSAGSGRRLPAMRHRAERIEAQSRRDLQLQSMATARIGSGAMQRMSHAAVEPVLREHRTPLNALRALSKKPQEELARALGRVEQHLRAVEAGHPRSVLPALRTHAEEQAFRNLRLSYDEMLRQGQSLGFIRAGRRDYAPRHWEGLGPDEPSIFASHMGGKTSEAFAKERRYPSVYDRGDPEAMLSHLHFSFDKELDGPAAAELTERLWREGAHRTLAEVTARRLQRGRQVDIDSLGPRAQEAVRNELDPAAGLLGEREGQLFLREDVTNPEQEGALRERLRGAGAREDSLDAVRDFNRMGENLTGNEREQMLVDDMARVEAALRQNHDDPELVEEYGRTLDELDRELHGGKVGDYGFGGMGDDLEGGPTSEFHRAVMADQDLADKQELRRFQDTLRSITPRLRKLRGPNNEQLTWRVHRDAPPEAQAQFDEANWTIDVWLGHFDTTKKEGIRQLRSSLIHELAHAQLHGPGGPLAGAEARLLKADEKQGLSMGRPASANIARRELVDKDLVNRLGDAREEILKSLRPEMKGKKEVIPDIETAMQQLVTKSRSRIQWNERSRAIIRKLATLERDPNYEGQRLFYGPNAFLADETAARYMELLATEPTNLHAALGDDLYRWLTKDVLGVQAGELMPLNPAVLTHNDIITDMSTGKAYVRGRIDNTALNHRPGQQAMGYVTNNGLVRTWHESDREDYIVYHEDMAIKQNETYVVRFGMTPQGRVSGIHGDAYNPGSGMEGTTEDLVQQRIEDVFGPGDWGAGKTSFSPIHMKRPKDVPERPGYQRNLERLERGFPEHAEGATGRQHPYDLSSEGQARQDLVDRMKKANEDTFKHIRWAKEHEDSGRPDLAAKVLERAELHHGRFKRMEAYARERYGGLGGVRDTPDPLPRLEPGPDDDPSGPGGALPDWRGTNYEHPATNPMLTDFYRSSSQSRAAAWTTQWRELDRAEGRWVNDERLAKVSGDRWQDMDSGAEYIRPEVAGRDTGVSEGRVWPARVVHEANAEFHRYHDWEAINKEGAAALFERVMTQVRWGVTSPFPAYHLRNMASDVLKSLQADSGVMFHPIANFTAMRAAFGGTKGTVDVPGLGRLALPDFLMFADAFGVRTGEHVMDFGRIVGRNPNLDVNTAHALARRFQRATLQFGSRREDVMRMTTFLQRMRRNGGDAADAMWYTIRHHFDYGDLNKFERRVVRNLFLFYTWYRKNIPLQLAELIRRPGFLAGVYHNYEAVEEGRQPAVNRNWAADTGIPFLPDTSGPLPKIALRPEYLTERLGALGLNWNGHAMYLGFGAPWADLGLLQPAGARQALSMTNPLVSLVLGLTAKRNLLTWAEYREGEPSSYAALLEKTGLSLAHDQSGRPVLPWWANVLAGTVPGFGRLISPLQTGAGWNQAGVAKDWSTIFTGITPWVFPKKDSKEYRQYLDIASSIELRQLNDYISGVRNLERGERHRRIKRYMRTNVRTLPHPVLLRIAKRVTGQSKHLSDRERIKKLLKIRGGFQLLHEDLTPEQRKKREEKRKKQPGIDTSPGDEGGGGLDAKPRGGDEGLGISGIGGYISGSEDRREGIHPLDAQEFWRRVYAGRSRRSSQYARTRRYGFANPFEDRRQQGQYRRWRHSKEGRRALRLQRAHRKDYRRRMRYLKRHWRQKGGGGSQLIPGPGSGPWGGAYRRS